MTKSSFTVEEAKKKLEHYCAYQERCHQEVKNKLVSMHMIPEAINYIIVHLIKHDFLNEQRYAEAFVSGKFKIKHWGKIKISIALKQKGIHSNLIKSALSTIDETLYTETLDLLARKQAEKIKDTNIFSKKKKLSQYLLYRGWESHLVYDKINELIN